METNTIVNGHNDGPIVSHGLISVVERDDRPIDCGWGDFNEAASATRTKTRWLEVISYAGEPDVVEIPARENPAEEVPGFWNRPA